MSDRPPEDRMAECIRLLDAKDYYNGGQTVRLRYGHGTEARAAIVAEAAFWQSQIRDAE